MHEGSRCRKAVLVEVPLRLYFGVVVHLFKRGRGSHSREAEKSHSSACWTRVVEIVGPKWQGPRGG